MLLKTVLFLNLGLVEDNGKIKNTKIKKFLFLSFFKSWELAIYLLISLTKTLETLPYISDKTTPHLVQVCFRFLESTFRIPFVFFAS